MGNFQLIILGNIQLILTLDALMFDGLYEFLHMPQKIDGIPQRADQQDLPNMRRRIQSVRPRIFALPGSPAPVWTYDFT